ncbi:GNAT family N-acetyltransferase [Luteimonas aquatica]|uniref:GNAT family N-acetyltransferase n=1 Tax=Luteimonas aquatica TaxID=450364 RepID=UPI001F599DFB|nr:GNAT family N-acetyltransferase [Luteimonas aquatica]
MSDAIEIRHDSGARRFETLVEGHGAYVEYRLEGGVMAIIHTIVPDAIGGRGIAAALVREALEYARGAGLKVSPHCSYAVAYLKKHPEYADLAA